jgi:hypothetical protein
MLFPVGFADSQPEPDGLEVREPTCSTWSARWATAAPTRSRAAAYGCAQERGASAGLTLTRATFVEHA